MNDTFKAWWRYEHQQDPHTDAGLIQAEGFGVVRDGLPEMACYAPEPEPSLWHWVWTWVKAPSFWS